MSKYPIEFIDRMKVYFGADYDAFIAALDTPPVTSVRTHPWKFSSGATALPLADAVPWATTGHYLSSRPSFTFDPLFHAGAYYVQESSSMFLEQALKATEMLDKPIRVLDMCAAPGGKSTHILSLINQDSLLVSNEIIASRNHTLRQNLARWGYANSIVTQNKAEDFARLGETFDVIVVDAPCSGEGLFRKDKAAIDEWSATNVTMCAERQEDILQHLMKCLKPGGYLIYSTCTYEDVENMAHVRNLTKQSGFISIEIPGAAQFHPQLTDVSMDGLHGYAFYPHLTRGEGFFISVLRKPGEWRETKVPPTRIADKTIQEIRPQLDLFVRAPEEFIAIRHQGIYNILLSKFWQDYRGLARLYVRNAGICAGEIKGKDLIPAHELSLFLDMRPDFPCIDLDHSTAITFLKGETVSTHTDHSGWVVMRHNGLNLGFAKALPNRINSYFPKEWRILKSQP